MTIPLKAPERARVYIGLDQGEAQVLALAEEHSARLIIIDEYKGRRYAQRLGMSLTGTLGVLLLAKERKLVPRVAPMLSQLQDEGLYLDQNLIDRVLAVAGEPKVQ